MFKTDIIIIEYDSRAKIYRVVYDKYTHSSLYYNSTEIAFPLLRWRKLIIWTFSPRREKSDK